MATNTTGNLGVAIEPKLSKQAISILSNSESLLNIVTDYSKLIAEDGQTASIVKMNAGGAIQSKAEDGEFVTQLIDIEPVVLTVDLDVGDAIEITDKQTKAQKVNTTKLWGEQTVSKMGDYLNDDVIGITNANIPVGNILGDGTGNITAQMVSEAAEILDEAKAPKTDRYLVVSTKQFYRLKLLPEFVTASYNGENSTANTQLGTLFGFRVIAQTTSSVGSNCFASHKSAIGYISDDKVTIEYARLTKKKADLIVINKRYGLGPVNSEFSVGLNVLAV